VLAFGILLVDDKFLLNFAPRPWRARIESQLAPNTPAKQSAPAEEKGVGLVQAFLKPHFKALKVAFAAVMLTWIFYATGVQLLWLLVPHFPLPTTPVVLLEPSRIANQYGLFAVMTR